MSGIGPQIPPQLASSSSSTSSSSSSSTRVGPHLPPSAAGPASPPRVAGPTLPSAGPSAPSAAAAESDSDDDFGPALPPDLAAARIHPSVPSSSSSAAPPKKVLGPTLPPSFGPGPFSAPSPPPARKRETPLSNLYSDDDDDDDFGPRPLPAGYVASEENEGARLVREREERQKERLREEERKKNEKPKRDEWMMVPPKEMDLMSSMDTTKLKSRGFQQMAGKGMSYGSSGKPNPNEVNLWTETPQERQKRLEDEMMGRKRKAEISNGGGGPAGPEETDEQRRKRFRDQQLRDEVERHNKSSRSASLLDQHSKSSKGKGKDKDDKGPPGIWDHERDMSVGGRLLDDSKRADMIKGARDLGGRFGGGSFL